MKLQNLYIYLLGCVIATLSSSPLSAQEAIDLWLRDLSTLKYEVSKGEAGIKAPIYSKALSGSAKPLKMSYDVSSLQSVSIVVEAEGANDATACGAILNPTLVDTQGNRVALTSLAPKYAVSTLKEPSFDKNFDGEPIIAHNKIYETGVVMQLGGELIYELNSKYTTLEMEVCVINYKVNWKGWHRFAVMDSRFLPDALYERLAQSSQLRVRELLARANIKIEATAATTELNNENRAITRALEAFEHKAFVANKLAEWEQIKALPISLDKYEKAYKFVDQITSLRIIYDKFVWVKPESLELLLSDLKRNPGYDYAKYAALLQQIHTLYPAAQKGLLELEPQALKAAWRVVELNRDIILSNPALDADKVLFSRYKMGDNARNAMAPRIGMPADNWTSLVDSNRGGFDAEISQLSDLRSASPTLTTIYKPEDSRSINTMRMHWDADKVIFTSNVEDRWRIFEVGVDGENLTEVIADIEPDLDFMDATYLPDGRIIATSNIGYQAVPCVHGVEAVVNTVLYDRESGKLRRLTFDQDGNWSPVIMNNGRVMYTRWEYTDLTHYFSRIIMHMNPDGTENKALYGSGSYWPTSMFDAYPLPGQNSQFVCIVSGHHGVSRSGKLFIFDPNKSRKEEKGVVQELPFKDRVTVPEIKDKLVDGVWPQFVMPFPITDKYFLVSAKLHQDGLWGIYLVDIYDNMICLAESEGEGFNNPIMVEKRTTPPVIPDKVNLSKKDATVFIQDIYDGEGSMGLPRGVVKELRIFAYEYAYHLSPSNHDGQGIRSGWDLKRLLGTVPVEQDGSVIFTVPANTPISLQPVDEDGGAVQWMRSWFTAMPGEIVSCIGCHEDQNQIPIPKRTIASQKCTPHPIEAPEGGVRSFTFDLEIQPILDRACVACHSDQKRAGGISFVKHLDEDYPVKVIAPWSTSYLKFMPYFYRQGSEAEIQVLDPYEYHASNSEMVRILKRGHYGVELTDEEWRKLYQWIDLNTPYHGQFFDVVDYKGHDQYERRIELTNKYANGAGVDWRAEIEEYTAYLASKGETTLVMPKLPKASRSKKAKCKSWPMTAAQTKELQAERGETRRTIEIAEGIEMNFVWIPAGEFIMGSDNGPGDSAPAFKAEVKRGFWMSQTEVSNEQYSVFDPEHDSRYNGQMWKDHTTPGYVANESKQPVIRISSEEAQRYCKEIGDRVGLQMSLPTETQWEWAARAGSDTPFWYGTHNDDFGSKENMADKSTSLLAVKGLNPKPMPENDPLRKYWDYLPKQVSVDDGAMTQVAVGSYQANPWGLHDMHGNVAELTLSSYDPYPLKGRTEGSSDEIVVRGGSWTDRPKESTSYIRKPYKPWQMAYNVGFRVIIIE